MDALGRLEEGDCVTDEPGSQRPDFLVTPVPPPEREESRPYFGAKAITHDLSGIADNDSVRRNRLADDGSRPDDRTIADQYSRENRRTEPDPDIVPDHRGALVDDIAGVTRLPVKQNGVEGKGCGARCDVLTAGEDSHLWRDAAERSHLDARSGGERLERTLVMTIGVTSDDRLSERRRIRAHVIHRTRSRVKDDRGLPLDEKSAGHIDAVQVDLGLVGEKLIDCATGSLPGPIIVDDHNPA
jgi:hypothetical protein